MHSLLRQAGLNAVSDHKRNTGPMQQAQRCGARTRAGVTCQSPAIRGAARCRMPGGKRSGAPEGNHNAGVTVSYTKEVWAREAKVRGPGSAASRSNRRLARQDPTSVTAKLTPPKKGPKMRDKYFAGQSARITEICRLNRDDMWLIIGHASCPVDRISLARECRKRMAQPAWMLSRYGPRRIRAANEELGASVQFTLRTIDWLLRPRDGGSEAERPVELEAATLLAEVIALIVDAEALKIPHLQELNRALMQSASRTFNLCRVSQGANPAFSKLDKDSLIEIESNAIGLGIVLDHVQSAIPHKIAKLRRPRRHSAGAPYSQLA